MPEKNDQQHTLKKMEMKTVKYFVLHIIEKNKAKISRNTTKVYDFPQSPQYFTDTYKRRKIGKV